jgi:hypothetical protein
MALELRDREEGKYVELLIVLALFIALDVAVLLAGYDSRDGRDWR